VQIVGSAVQVVEIRVLFREELFGQESHKSSLLELRLNRNHLLVQDTHDTNPTKLESVEHNVLPVLMPSKF
jgi:hypothetical protein